MPEPQQNRRGGPWVKAGWGRATLAIMIALGLTSTAPAASFGEVDVTVEDSPQGAALHGYGEVWARVANKSTTAPHVVRLTLTGASYNMSDYIRDVSRTMTIEPGKATRVSLAYPEPLMNVASGLTVTIDGSEQKTKLPLPVAPSAGRYGTGLTSLVLYSKAVDTRFPDWVGRFVGLGRTGSTIEFIRAGLPATEWGANWLGYTRYGGVVLTADDLRQMSAEVRSAIAQYVECGGSLFVLGAAPQLPTPWKPRPLPRSLLQNVARDLMPDLLGCSVGFGQCLITDKTDLSSWDFAQSQIVFNTWVQSQRPWFVSRTTMSANQSFPVIEDLGIPVNGLLLLMFVFSFVIGPLNLYVLGRMKRKLWFFWTVPLMSLITCVGVFGYTALREGWNGRSRVEGVTILDENTRRASTIGWSAFYTPLLAGGLHFSPETEVSSLGVEEFSFSSGYRMRRGNALTMDWTQDQHLASGWLTPRVPAHFAIRKGEPRRERVTIGKGASGLPEAVNGLGVDISELWYCDEKQKFFYAQNIPTGGRATLEAATGLTNPEGPRPLSSLYTGDWSNLATRLRTEGTAYLRPRMYMVALDSAPFLDDGLSKYATKKAKSIVFGILKEGGDEG